MSDPNQAATADAGAVKPDLTSGANGQNKPADSVFQQYAGEITDDTPIDALPPGLQRHIKELRAESAKVKKAKKESDAAAEAERVAALERKGEYETLVNELKSKVEPMQSRIESLEKAIKAFNKARIDSMPDADRALVPELDDPIAISAWLDKYHSRNAQLAATTGAGANGAAQATKPTPPPTNAGANGAGKSDAVEAQREQTRRAAAANVRSIF